MVLDRDIVRRRRREFWAAVALLLSTVGCGAGVCAGLLLAPGWVAANAWLPAVATIAAVGMAVRGIVHVSTDRPRQRAALSPPPTRSEMRRRRELGPESVPALPTRTGT